MTRGKKSKLERTAKKIIPMNLDTDNVGKFISYCDYGQHQGVIGSEKAKDCYDKGCIHYRKYREDGAWGKVE